MTTRDQICAVCDAYVAAVSAHDVDAIMAVFAPGAAQEEPVGSAPNVGHEAIRAFFAATEDFPFTVRRIGPITVSGDVAAFQIGVDFPDGAVPSMTSTDVATFDGDGLIKRLVAIPDGQADPDFTPA